MTMKKWRFFPVLIKENIVKHMCIPDIVSFAKCLKNCENLLTFVPIHLPSALIDDRFYHKAFLGPRLTFGLDLITVDHFSILATSRKFYIDQLYLCVITDKNKHDVNNLIEKLTKARKSLKVKKLRMDFGVEHAELFTEILGIYDPSCIEFIEIPLLLSKEVYHEIVKTPQWRNSKRVSLNYMLHQGLNLPNVNIDDFLHFENVQLRVERLDTNDAVKFVQKFRNASKHAEFVIECREPMQHDSIRQKIEAGWVGDWQQSQYSNTRFVIDPANPNHVFYVEYSPFCLRSGWSLLDEFNAFQVFIGGLVALH